MAQKADGSFNNIGRIVIMYKAEEVVGIAIVCSDPRANLWKRVKQVVIPHGRIYVPISVLGGPISLVYPQELNLDHHTLLGQIHFALSGFPHTAEILSVTHDCGYYEKMGKNPGLQTKKEDAGRISAFIKAHFDLQVRSLFADDQESERFEEIR